MEKRRQGHSNSAGRRVDLSFREIPNVLIAFVLLHLVQNYTGVTGTTALESIFVVALRAVRALIGRYTT